jgi:hypothetical protein
MRLDLKCKMRPTKLTDNFIEVATGIIFDDINAIILTDEELVMLINEKLSEKARISDRTFQRWKDKNKNESDDLDEIGKQFCRLIKKALVIQKRHLFDKFREEPNQWQKWAWIIERKFDDWNIKRKSDVTSDNKPIPIINVLQDNSNEKDTETE